MGSQDGVVTDVFVKKNSDKQESLEIIPHTAEGKHRFAGQNMLHVFLWPSGHLLWLSNLFCCFFHICESLLD